MNAEDSFAFVLYSHDYDFVYIKHIWLFPISRKEEILTNYEILEKECNKIHEIGLRELHIMRESWATLPIDEYTRNVNNFWKSVIYKKDQAKKEFIDKYCYNPIELNFIYKYDYEVLVSEECER